MSKITQAFVLAAGLGTRLRSLTEEVPKPLIPIFQKPLVTFAFDHLIGLGVNRLVINTHRHPQLFQDFFAAREYGGFPVTLVHEQKIEIFLPPTLKLPRGRRLYSQSIQKGRRTLPISDKASACRSR